MRDSLSRRQWLERSLLLAAGAAAGHLADPIARALLHARPNGAVAAAPQPSANALSLSTLQRAAHKARRDGMELPDEVATLGGLNAIRGFVVDDGGDVILFGERDRTVPTIHIDDLMVALRSAYQTDPLYREPPGCSIDPRDDADDPWAIQAIRVLGMPRCRMARRHVALDYELKLVGGGLSTLDGVRSTFAIRQAQGPLCGGGSAKTNVTSRFWFCARYPEAPRFEIDNNVVLIDRPVDVQVLTERRLFGSGNDESAGPPDPVVEQFVHDVTQRLLAGDRREYLELRNDFRIVELGRLLRNRDVPPDGLAYLLADHQHEPVDVPEYVVGIERSEDARVVCGGTVTVAAGTIRGESQVGSRSLSYRGGVDADVKIPPSQFKQEEPGRFAELRKRVIRSRPSPDTMSWSIQRW